MGRKGKGTVKRPADEAEVGQSAQVAPAKKKNRNKNSREERTAERLAGAEAPQQQQQQQASTQDSPGQTASSTMDPFAVKTVTPQGSPEPEPVPANQTGASGAGPGNDSVAKPVMKKLTVLDLAKRDSETARLLTASHGPILDEDFRPIDKEARKKAFEQDAAEWEKNETTGTTSTEVGAVVKNLLQLALG